MNDFSVEFEPERLMWRSDYPFYHVGCEVEKIQLSAADEDERRPIAGQYQQDTRSQGDTRS